MLFKKQRRSSPGAIVDERNPVPVNMVIPLFTRFYRSHMAKMTPHDHLAVPKVPKARALKKAATLMPLELSRQNMGRPSCDNGVGKPIFHSEVGELQNRFTSVSEVGRQA